jgi:hypothetical protein
MRFLPFQVLLALPASAQIQSIFGSFPSNTSLLGNIYNSWYKPSASVFDLTRSNVLPTTSPKTIRMLGSRKTAIIEPSRSALVIIDMQNYFLHPSLSPRATGGRTAVQPTVDMVKGFRKAGMKVLWTNWGLDEFDLLTIPPSFLSGFSGGTDDVLRKCVLGWSVRHVGR